MNTIVKDYTKELRKRFKTSKESEFYYSDILNKSTTNLKCVFLLAQWDKGNKQLDKDILRIVRDYLVDYEAFVCYESNLYRFSSRELIQIYKKEEEEKELRKKQLLKSWFHHFGLTNVEIIPFNTNIWFENTNVRLYVYIDDCIFGLDVDYDKEWKNPKVRSLKGDNIPTPLNGDYLKVLSILNEHVKEFVAELE